MSNDSKEVMTTEQILKQKMEDMSQKVKTIILEDLPDELIQNMVQAQIKEFTSDKLESSYGNKTVPFSSPLAKMVKEELDSRLKAQVKQAFDSEFNQLDLLTGEAKEKIIKNYSKIFMEGFIQNMTAMFLQSMTTMGSAVNNLDMNMTQVANRLYNPNNGW